MGFSINYFRRTNLFSIKNWTFLMSKSLLDFRTFRRRASGTSGDKRILDVSNCAIATELRITRRQLREKNWTPLVSSFSIWGQRAQSPHNRTASTNAAPKWPRLTRMKSRKAKISKKVTSTQSGRRCSTNQLAPPTANICQHFSDYDLLFSFQKLDEFDELEKN